MSITSSRHKVLAYLTRTRTAAVREIARALKMSPANVRHHLRVLVSDGRLEVLPAAEHARRGRPEKLYTLPRAAWGDNLSALSDALLSEAGMKARVEAVAQRLAGESDFADQPIVKRLNLVIEKLNQMNDHARWEAGRAGPRLILAHCPYAAIIGKHPELCKMDAVLLKELTGEGAEQVSQIGREKSQACVFVMGR